jgi:hypothetical protein
MKIITSVTEITASLPSLFLPAIVTREKGRRMGVESNDDIQVSRELLTRWAENCLHMNHLGTLVQREITKTRGNARTLDLAERARTRAWILFNELIAHGAKKLEKYTETDAPPPTLREYDVVRLKHSTFTIPVQPGTEGTVLIVHPAGLQAYEVEFMDAGISLGVFTVYGTDLEPVK